ncbi:YqhG family protein [Bacillus ndiopicus]|uniref:YqhG family protein n=1 Tax=Bacillus ndiopicus TaxID=1347368 RepID=UPI000A74A97F|nr:YqhG family protein [Bacillus ndiopicus]
MIAMNSQQINQFLHDFFIETGCDVERQEELLHVQLSIEMDKKIMNRPFYWRYIEATNGEPNPAQLKLTTSLQRGQGEIIHFGSPRLQQIYRVVEEFGAYVQMYEEADVTASQVLLTPWLAVNYKVAYCCDCTKEVLYSFGLNLMTGYMVLDFHSSLIQKNLIPTKPANGFCVQHIIAPQRGLERIQAALNEIIVEDDHTWANEAIVKWQREQRILDYFYDGVDDKPEMYEIEKQALQERYGAKIKMTIVNGGLFYLK